jgi:hypothetical protein
MVQCDIPCSTCLTCYKQAHHVAVSVSMRMLARVQYSDCGVLQTL